MPSHIVRQKEAFLLKKLFQHAPILEITDYKQFKWHGNYTIINASEKACTCMLDDFIVHINGEEVQVDVLATNGFSVTCKKLHKVTIERHV